MLFGKPQNHCLFLMNSYPSVLCTLLLLLSPLSSHSVLSQNRRPLFSLILSSFSLVIVQLLQEKSPLPLFTWKIQVARIVTKHKPLKIAPKSSSETCYPIPAFLSMCLPLNTNFPDKRSFCFYVVLFCFCFSH